MGVASKGVLANISQLRLPRLHVLLHFGDGAHSECHAAPFKRHRISLHLRQLNRISGGSRYTLCEGKGYNKCRRFLLDKRQVAKISRSTSPSLPWTFSGTECVFEGAHLFRTSNLPWLCPKCDSGHVGTRAALLGYFSKDSLGLT